MILNKIIILSSSDSESSSPGVLFALERFLNAISSGFSGYSTPEIVSNSVTGFLMSLFIEV
jgi:hypothetical protein